MLEGNEEVVQLQLRAGNISSGRPAGQCAKEQKKRDASEQSTEEAPSSEEVEVAPRRFDGTMQPGWGFLMPKSSSLSPPAAASTAPGKGATAAPAPKKAKVSHETMALKWQTVCGWREGAMTTARMVDDAVLLARVFKEQKQKQPQQDLTRSASSSSAGSGGGVPTPREDDDDGGGGGGGGSSSSAGGGGASSSSSQASSSYTVSDSGGSSARAVTEEVVQGAWKAATKGANTAPKFPGTLKLAGRAMHSECELDMDLVTTFKGEDQPPSWECDSCESGCNHNVWKCSVCNTLYRVSRSSSMKEHFLQKEHLDNLDTKVLKQRADAANAPASSVTQVVRHDYSHLPAAVVR